MCSLFCAVILLFRHNEGRYRLPAPIPQNPIPVPIGSFVDLRNIAGAGIRKPLLLYFFNPDCFCSISNLVDVKNWQNNVAVRQLYACIGNWYELFTGRNPAAFTISIAVVKDSCLSVPCGDDATPQPVTTANAWLQQALMQAG